MKAATKHMVKRKVTKVPKQQELPVNDTPSNAKGDNMAMGLFFALMIASATTLGGGVYISSSRFVNAITSNPIDWGTAITMTLLLTVTYLVARSLLWLAFFGPVMLASRIGAWSTCEKMCRQAIKLPKTLSRGSSWAAVALVQSLVGRGKFRDAINLAEEEWARSGEDPKQVQNLGPLCVAVGIAAQVENNMKESLQWNERAISCLTQSYEDLQKPKSGVFAKAMGTQSVEWIGQVRTQLAVAYFNTATIYFQKQDHRRAKENFKKSVDFANQAPDFPQKSDILKMSRDQLARLKHA
jgi:tetratricopeptide (TPR) repeat protein